MDHTAARRVRSYRIRQKADRRIARIEIQVPDIATGDVRALGRKLRGTFKRAMAADRQIRLILGTINAPRRHPIDARSLVHCLTTFEPEARWRPHMEALFDEVSPEAVHDLVLAKVVTFEDLYRAARNWEVRNGANVAWIREMADLRLARPSQ
ncbi:MAG: hypothetical protein AB7S92_10890 [Parvibaculaceae bacterium]